MTLRRASIVLLLAIIFGLTLPAQGRAQSGGNATDEAYNRGTNLLNSGRYREAIPYFDEAIRLNPRMRLPTTTGVLPMRILVNTSVRFRTMTRRIRLNPRYADAYYNRGIAYEKLGQYQRAIQDYDEAIRPNPRYADAYNNRGIAYDSLGQYQRAIQDYDEAIRLNLRYTDAYNNRGIAYKNLGQYQRAI